MTRYVTKQLERCSCRMRTYQSFT